VRAVFATLLLTACSPEIAPGTYACGPEELCPEGMACDRTTALCENRPQEFACGDRNPDVPGDDSPATAQSFGELQCVSLVQERRSCLPLGDAGDFFEFTVAPSCTASHVKARVTFPVAFQHVVLQLGKAGETPMTIETPCTTSDTDDGSDSSCLDAPVSAGTYVLGVVPDGKGTCDNECRFNRYSVAVQIVTP
jgi:hypothetical protein